MADKLTYDDSVEYANEGSDTVAEKMLLLNDFNGYMKALRTEDAPSIGWIISNIIVHKFIDYTEYEVVKYVSALLDTITLDKLKKDLDYDWTGSGDIVNVVNLVIETGLFGVLTLFRQKGLKLRQPKIRYIILAKDTKIYHTRKTLFSEGNYPYHEYNWLTSDILYWTDKSRQKTLGNDYAVYTYFVKEDIIMLAARTVEELNYYLYSLDSDFRPTDRDYGTAKYVCSKLMLKGYWILYNWKPEDQDILVLCGDTSKYLQHTSTTFYGNPVRAIKEEEYNR